MRHCFALESERGRQVCNCHGELEFVSSGYWSDVYWSIYVCNECGARICTVGGRPHRYNFVSDKSEHVCDHEYEHVDDREYCVKCGRAIAAMGNH